MPNNNPSGPSGPRRTFDAAEQKLLDRTRATAEKGRAEKIGEMNDARPAPKMVVEHTPTGPIRKEVDKAVTAQKNAEINKRIGAFKEQMRTLKGKARSDFNRDRGR